MIDGRYRRPDLLLESDSGEKLMVEIWVSHETGDEKRKQGKVLEIKISSEDDIDKIRTHKLTQSKPSDKSLRYFVWKEICPDPELPRNFAEENSDRLLVREEGFPGRLRPQEREWLVSQAHYRIIRPPVNLTHPLDPETLKEVSVGDIPFWKREKGLEWVNLGLPSGTLWSKEYMGSMTFEEVMREFPHLIPNLEQYQELASLCKTTIPNPAGFIGPTGFIGPNGVLLEMYEGDFWVDFSIDESHAVAFHKYDVVNRAQHNKLPLLQVLGFVKADKRKRLCVRLVKNER